MYESPIQTVFSGIEIKTLVDAAGEYVVRAVQRMDVQVDKEELIKALKYDRGQYEKGFADGLSFEPPVKSNADRIRAMTDDELAGYLSHIDSPYRMGYARKDERDWLDWLKQEVDSD